MALNEPPDYQDPLYQAVAASAWPQLVDTVRAALPAGVDLTVSRDKDVVFALREPSCETLEAALEAAVRFGYFWPDVDEPMEQACARSIKICLTATARRRVV